MRLALWSYSGPQPLLMSLCNISTNITSSIKLHNTKLHVVGHYFCCTISQAVYCKQAKHKQDALHRSSNKLVGVVVKNCLQAHAYFLFH